MRRRTGLVLLVICLLLGVSSYLMQGSGLVRKAYTSDNLIRFHVIANSDDRGDQRIKYLVRDALVTYLKPKLKKASSYREARQIVLEHREELAGIARQVLENAGYRYPVKVEVGRFDFPARAYGELVLPAGGYEAVRVVLGEGKGANWWCVLFPPLCLVDISGAPLSSHATDSLTEEAVAGQLPDPVVPEGVDLRFRVWDWLQDEGGYLARLINS